MSLDKIQLPDFLIADLYKNCLVEVENGKENAEATLHRDQNEAVVSSTEMPEKAIKYLGQNGQQVIVVVNNSDVVFVNDSEMQFLTTILKACNFNLGDIAIVNLNNKMHTYQELKENLSARYLLLFGTEPADIRLPFTIPQFQVQQYAGCTIVAAPALSELNKPTQEGKLLKSKLWLSLQRCFNI